MNLNALTSLQHIKYEVSLKEREIESVFRKMERRERVQINRPSDYGTRYFSLMMYFDEINVNAFSEDKIQNIIQLLIEYDELRKKQLKIETQCLSENSFKEDIKRTML